MFPHFDMIVTVALFVGALIVIDDALWGLLRSMGPSHGASHRATFARVGNGPASVSGALRDVSPPRCQIS